MMSTAVEWPLKGMRVLDLSTGIAGPYCTKLLVDAGAEVIKVEDCSGDPLRRYCPDGVELEGGDSALFRHLNASKLGLRADIREAGGRELICHQACASDIVVESFAPGAMAAAGLGIHELQAHNPALSMLSISPWGGDGPWAQRPASEFTLQAATGATDHRCRPGSVPVAAGGSIGEWVAGSYAAVAAMFAFLSARRSGCGHHVDLSMFEAMLLAMTPYHDLNGQWRRDPLHRAIEVPSIEPAKDGWVGFCTITGQQWKDFCLLIGSEELAADDSYLEGFKRSRECKKLHGIIHAWTRERSVEEIVEAANLLRIPAVPVGDGKRLPEFEHLRVRKVFVDGPGGFLRPRPAYLLEKTSLRAFGESPGIGEHNEELLGGMAAAKAVRAERAAGGQQPEAAAAGTGGAVAALERKTVLPLAGLRVVDLGTFWAGPVVGSLLSDMGADVIKVESIQRPDGMRFAGAIATERMWEWSPVFAGANTGKRGITLQLDSPEGLGLLKDLIARSDVVIENFSPRVMENFGLGWEELKKLNPRLIMVRMPAFGLTGPWRDRPGFAMTVEQLSGLAWVTGYRDLPLVVRGVCDPVAGMHATFALLMALEHRRRSGEGQLVEAALLESALNIAAEQVIEYSAYGSIPGRLENRAVSIAPQGVYPCGGEGRYLALSVCSDEQWAALCRLLGDPQWTRDPELAEARGRRRRHDEIDEALCAWLSEHDLGEAEALLLDAGIPAQQLLNGHRLMPHPQLEHRHFFQVMEHAVSGTTRYPGLPMTFSGMPRALHVLPPPTLGEHNEEVLRDLLGLSRERIEELRARKVIGDRPAFL